MFAMPYFGTRVGEEDYPRLDPGDPDERRLLIEGEHPEYHAVLDDQGFEGEVDGVNPRLHIAIHEVVANQLWEDEPPEAWRAAKRLRDAGVDRHDILHQLGSVATGQLHGALTRGQPVDLGAYRQALDALRPPLSGRRAKSAAAPVKGAVYQVKISLHGARPPIWRRLRLPASTTLAQLHQVIQAAFGWEDAHLHAFEAGGRRYSRPDFELWDEAADEGKARGTSSPVPAPGCATPTTSATPGSTTSSSRTSSHPTASGMPSASLAAEPARPRTAAACGAMPSSATSLPTRGIQTTLNGSNGSGALMTRPPSTRTQSMHLWLGSGSADQFASAG
jgi:hypothetical protein